MLDDQTRRQINGMIIGYMDAKYDQLITEFLKVEKSLSAKIDALRAEMMTQIEALRAESKAQIEALRAEMMGHIDALRTEVGTLRAEMVTKEELTAFRERNYVEMAQQSQAIANMQQAIMGIATTLQDIQRRLPPPNPQIQHIDA